MKVVCDKCDKCDCFGGYCAHKEIHEHSSNCGTLCGVIDDCNCNTKMIRKIKLEKLNGSNL